MIKTFKYKLYKSKKNKHIYSQINIAGIIYNHCIALHRRYYRRYNKFLNMYQLQKHLTKLKHIYKYWKQVSSQTIQDITERIHKAYKLFFNNIKKKIKASPPKFRKVKKYKSITFKNAGFKHLDNNQIKIQKKIYKYFKSREIEGEIKNVVIKRDLLNDLYIYFICDVKNNPKKRVMTGNIAGFDFGMKTFLYPSDNSEKIQTPLFFKKNIKLVKSANKFVSSKKKGSNNRKKAILKLARIHKKIVNQRQDFNFKLARTLALKYDFLFFETLDIKAMQAKWGRKISDLAFTEFISILKYMCEKLKSKLTFIGKFFPSSKKCNICNEINQNLTLSDRTWTCQNCGTKHDRDKNAAVNILIEGASSIGLEIVNPKQLGRFCLKPESHSL